MAARPSIAVVIPAYNASLTLRAALASIAAQSIQPDEALVFVGSLFSRTDYARSGGFREGLAEDWDLWIRMVREGVVIRRADHPTVLYRWSEESSGAGFIDMLTEPLDRARQEMGSPDE